MKNIRKLNSTMFDVAPPFIILGVVFVIFIISLLISLVLFALRLVRKAIARNKAKANSGIENNVAAGPDNEGK